MSEIIVQKFGGTSVGSVDRIESVAEIVKNASLLNSVIVVVSAMSGETNKLIKLANHFGDNWLNNYLPFETPTHFYPIFAILSVLCFNNSRKFIKKD